MFLTEYFRQEGIDAPIPKELLEGGKVLNRLRSNAKSAERNGIRYEDYIKAAIMLADMTWEQNVGDAEYNPYE